jgi:sec-independent protein translocase protein TatB
MFAFVFDSVSGGEWLVLLAVILIIVGPKNLPSTARKVGEIMSKLRRAADEFKRQLMTMDDEMRKTADEIKKEYIDIPEDGADRAVTDASDASDEDPYGYGLDDPDYPGEYSDGYPDEEDYGESDDSGPYMGEADNGGSSAEPAGSETPAQDDAAESAAPSAPETPEKNNG